MVKISIVGFWRTTSCGLVGGYQRFGRANRFHLQEYNLHYNVFLFDVEIQTDSEIVP